MRVKHNLHFSIINAILIFMRRSLINVSLVFTIILIWALAHKVGFLIFPYEPQSVDVITKIPDEDENLPTKELPHVLLR